MSNFAIIRLGKDSVNDIRQIDGLHSSPSKPLALTVKCSQVPPELKPGDFAFLCLGSDNNNGTPTPWTRGMRALGTITSKAGGRTYKDQADIGVQIKVVFPESVTRKLLLEKAATAYFGFCEIPVLGVDTHSNQTIQLIKQAEANQDVSALLFSLNQLFPNFKAEATAAYPALANMFDYMPPSSVAGGEAAPVVAVMRDEGDMKALVANFINDANECSLRIEEEQARRFFASLLSKRFLIATGLAGSGKTKLAQAVSRWITPMSTFLDPFEINSEVESDGRVFIVRSSDSLAVELWNAEYEAESTKVVLPRQIIDEWARQIEELGFSRATPAPEIRDAAKSKSIFGEKLHSFDAQLKAAAFALIESRRRNVPSKCFEIVPVGADWTGNENVVGYPNGLDAASYVGKPALSLILRAMRNPDLPHFLILDEMNLSHVERYFADVLSAIESDEDIHLHADAERRFDGQVVPGAVALPQNLFIIGTVNVDETTYMFSPKVLDRANVIEFRMRPADLQAFLDNPSKPDMVKIRAKGVGFGKVFVSAAKSSELDVTGALKAEFDAELLMFFEIMSGNGAEFGYRVAHESTRFIHFFKVLGNYSDADLEWLSSAIDCLILQKFLPKLHGSRTKLGPLLKKLWFVCTTTRANRASDVLGQAEAAAKSNERTSEPSLPVASDAPYPDSAEKIARMWRLLNENGFASFAEA